MKSKSILNIFGNKLADKLMKAIFCNQQVNLLKPVPTKAKTGAKCRESHHLKII